MKRMQQRTNTEGISSNISKKNGSKARECLTPPISYSCSLCSCSYHTIQALAGHQNAHRKEPKELLMKYIQEYKKTQRDEPVLSPTPIRAMPPIPDYPNPNHSFKHFVVPTPIRMTNEIDLELGLQFEPNNFIFHEFLPIRRGYSTSSKGKGIAYEKAHDDPCELKLGTGVGISKRVFYGGDSSNKNLDLNLKL
ncbi:zinc finger protein 6-like [Quillaja saponaria]|uniref:Zinc finger protein 6-like n=1 Tax=Quillaja saponaria TaxID=32244 RepID=A0AAD7Q6Z0_QUISA|nr:zinc finger protein 6-like [Quillaja saponaria]